MRWQTHLRTNRLQDLENMIMEILRIAAFSLAIYATSCTAAAVSPKGTSTTTEAVDQSDSFPSVIEFRPVEKAKNGWLEYTTGIKSGYVLKGEPDSEWWQPYSVNGSVWRAFDTGALAADGYKVFKMFLIGENWWKEAITCWKGASMCLNNDLSDETNSQQITATTGQSFSTTAGMTLGTSFEGDMGVVKASVSVSVSLSATWEESVSFSQSITCNVAPKDTVQTLAQLPYTFVEGYNVDAECWVYKEALMKCWTKVDSNGKAFGKYGTYKIPVKDEKQVTMRCVSKKKLEKLGKILPCENKGEEVCIDPKGIDAIEAFAKPKSAGAISVF